MVVVALGSFALLVMASEPQGQACPAEREAAARAEPGFVALAGIGDPECAAR